MYAELIGHSIIIIPLDDGVHEQRYFLINKAILGNISPVTGFVRNAILSKEMIPTYKLASGNQEVPLLAC